MPQLERGIFQHSRMCHCYPHSQVSPARNITEDLRPILLTAVLSKQLESIVGKWMFDITVDKLDVR